MVKEVFFRHLTKSSYPTLFNHYQIVLTSSAECECSFFYPFKHIKTYLQSTMTEKYLTDHVSILSIERKISTNLYLDVVTAFALLDT